MLRDTARTLMKWLSVKLDSPSGISRCLVASGHALTPASSPLRSDSDSLPSPTRLSLSDGSEDHLDRLQQVELARMSPMSQWRAGTVQAWLEVIMAMPMYIRSCSENVKSGKVRVECCRQVGDRLRLDSGCCSFVAVLQVLLALTDEDLELGLDVSSVMHRRKLRLAIEDYREAESSGGWDWMNCLHEQFGDVLAHVKHISSYTEWLIHQEHLPVGLCRRGSHWDAKIKKNSGLRWHNHISQSLLKGSTLSQICY